MRPRTPSPRPRLILDRPAAPTGPSTPVSNPHSNHPTRRTGRPPWSPAQNNPLPQPQRCPQPMNQANAPKYTTPPPMSASLKPAPAVKCISPPDASARCPNATPAAAPSCPTHSTGHDSHPQTSRRPRSVVAAVRLTHRGCGTKLSPTRNCSPALPGRLNADGATPPGRQTWLRAAIDDHAPGRHTWGRAS